MLNLIEPPAWPATTKTMHDARAKFMASLGAHDMVMNADRLSERVAEAAPGTVLVYHLGMLVRDRAPKVSRLPEDQRIEVGVIADCALAFAEQGRVHLLQRRLAPRFFAYLLVVRPGPRLALTSATGSPNTQFRDAA